MHALELKVPPLVVVLLAAMLMWLVAWATPSLRLVLPGRYLLGGCFGLAGVLVTILGIAAFRRARTTVNPMNPQAASSLVTTGIYKASRNPMYLGFLLILIGWAILLANPLALLVLPAFILYMNRFQIRPEEAVLASMFGQDFAAYRSRVRRWL